MTIQIIQWMLADEKRFVCVFFILMTFSTQALFKKKWFLWPHDLTLMTSSSEVTLPHPYMLPRYNDLISVPARPETSTTGWKEKVWRLKASSWAKPKWVKMSHFHPSATSFFPTWKWSSRHEHRENPWVRVTVKSFNPLGMGIVSRPSQWKKHIRCWEWIPFSREFSWCCGPIIARVFCERGTSAVKVNYQNSKKTFDPLPPTPAFFATESGE